MAKGGRQELKTEIVLTGKTDGSAAQLFKDLAITAESSYNEICKAFQRYDDLQTQAYNRQKKQYNDMLQKQMQLAKAETRQKQQGRSDYVNLWQNLLKEQEDIEKQIAQEEAKADQERLQKEQERAREKEKRDKYLYQQMREFQEAAAERERAYAELFDEAERRLEENKLGNRIKKFVSELSVDLNEVGDELINVGGQVWKVGRQLLKTTELYADFDDTMRATQGKLVTATAQEMDALEEQVRQWAETTRFGAVETANAVKEAASSGWELTEIYEGIPTVMTLAATAGLDLTDATEYLNSALAGLNMDMSESATLVDQWVMASNRSRASVQDMGEAMQRLGSLMTFTESSDEVLTLLSVMAEYGTKGAEAGTMLRNVMLRLIAPTKKAAETLDMLDASEEELAELGEMDVAAAAKAMDTLGLSVFDAEGNLKSMIQVISELRRATSGMTEEEMYPMLAAIFPTRTLRGIMDLLRTSDEEYASIQNRIRSSSGYASEIAELQEGGIGGSIRNLESAFEELKLTVGEAMNPVIMQMTNTLTELIKSISDMPEGVWEGIGNILALVVEAGPVLIGVGVGMKIISKLLTPGGAIMAGVGGLIMLLTLLDKNIEERRQKKLENLFGTATLDVAEMRQETEKTTQSYLSNNSALNELMDTMRDGATNYADVLEQLQGDLTTFAITGQQLTEEQKNSLSGLINQMIDQANQDIDNGELHDLNMLDLLFGDVKTGKETDAFVNGVGWVSSYYDGLRADMVAVGEDLRNALTEALEDGELSPEDEEAIRAQIERLTEIEQQIQQGIIDQETGKRLYAAQKVSADSLEEYLQGNADSEAKALAANSETYAAESGRYYSAWKYNYDNATTGSERSRLQKELDSFMQELAREEEEAAQGIRNDYSGYNERALDTVISQLGYSDAWKAIKRIGELGVGADEADWSKIFEGLNANKTIQQMYDLYDADDATGWKLSKLVDKAGFTNLADIITMLNRYAGAADTNLAIQSDIDAFKRYMQEKQTTPDIADDEELKAQAAGDAQTYVSQAQATLDKNPLKIKVDMVYGQTISGGSTSSAGAPGSVKYKAFGTFADGGRADTASIFGEAGPEWAIPEKHTARTASLLEAAAKASGFGSLGLTAGGSSSGPATIIYSPVINAQDARGVDGALREDKKRLEKWWNERAARAEAEAFG